MNGTHISHTRAKGTRGKSYLRISRGPQLRQYVHRLVAEAMIGRPLKSDEAVDHIDGDTYNNHPSNLRVMTIVGNSKRSTPLELGDLIFDGASWWAEKNRSRNCSVGAGLKPAPTEVEGSS